MKRPWSQLWRLRKSCPVPATPTHRRCLLANLINLCTCVEVSGQAMKAGDHTRGQFRVDCLQKSEAFSPGMQLPKAASEASWT
mmetsp:Transcript_86775/g.265627  ORF Transcript_86775/g.265627 Transcript_86775/m.265627 type:complete len:83 (-) Transcript_86775:379-627(-)